MKNLAYFILGAFVALQACSPKNDEVTEEQIETGSQEQALDTISSTAKDALRTDENEVSPTLPLPQPVLQALAEKYPGFKQPSLADDVKKNTEDGEQGPIIVRTDLTNDNLQDYALQLQQDKEIIVVALLDKGDSTWTVHELKRDILFNERGKLRSLYYLTLLEKGEEINVEANETITLKNNAVAVGINNGQTVYVYENNAFKPYTLRN